MKNRSIKILSVIASCVILVGCGGGGSSTPPKDIAPNPTSKLTSGKVADGYIAGADVLVDINTTHKGFADINDTGDITYKTDSSGNFALDSNLNITIGTIIYAKGGTIVSTGKPFDGVLKAFYSEGGGITLSPLSTMVTAAISSGPVSKEKIASAKEKVAKALGIPKDKVTADPVKDPDAFKATQKVIAIAKVIKAHKAKNGEDVNVTKVLEDVALKISSGDSNLTKAVTDTVGSSNEQVAKDALKTAKTVEESIDKLKESGVTDSATLEQTVTQEVVDKAENAVKNDGNITAVLENVKIDAIVDVAKAANCLTFAKIKGLNSKSTEVTKPLDLSKKSECEENNVTITWINHSANINLSTGAVTRANYEDKIGFVEANISESSKSLTKPIYMTILSKGHKPVAKPDIVNTQENTAVIIDVLANDSDADGNSELNITSVTTPTNGSAVIENNKIKYTPNSNFNGVDNFVYTLTDPLGAEVNATVAVTVIGVNDAPVFGDIAIPAVDEDSHALTIPLSATDDDNDTLTYSVTVSDNSKASVDVNGSNLTITPRPNANGDVTITVTVSDGKGGANSKTFTLHINPVNDAPVLKDIANKSVNEDASPVIINLEATDIDGDALTYSATSSNNSVVAVNVIGNKLTITPKPNINGDANITVTVSDGHGGEDSKTFKFSVYPQNDAPVLATITNQNVNEDTNLTVNLTSTDADGDTVIYTAKSSDTSKAEVTVNGDKLIITPKPNINGDITITVTADDGKGGTDSKTFTVTINPVNDAPVLSAIDDVTLDEDSNVTVVELNATDIDSQNLHYSATISDNTLAAVNINGNRLQITPMPNANGDTNITVTVSDGNLSDSKAFRVHINPVNDAPVLSAIEDKEINLNSDLVSIDLEVTDIDNNISDLIFTADTDNPGAIGVSISNNNLTITPLAVGSGKVEVTVSDGNLSDSVLFNVNIFIQLPEGYDYQTINNKGEKVESNVTINGKDYIVKAFSNQDIAADSQKNHKLVVANINNGEVKAPLTIQSNYERVVIAIYDENNNLVAVSDITQLTNDNTIIPINLNTGGN